MSDPGAAAQPPVDPVLFHDFWARLSAADRDALWERDRTLSNRDGMPAADRDHYNRIALAAELAAAAVQGSAAAKFYPDLTRIHHELYDGQHDPARLLLLLDVTSGQDVHTAVSIGDPDRADHVATYVPGTGTRPSKMDRDMVRCQAMHDQAQLSGARRPAVVAWLGYDTPPKAYDVVAHLEFRRSPDDASNIRYADVGAPALDRFQDGLRASHVGDRSVNTVVAHSYGATVAGNAAAHGRSLNADALALVASPGETVSRASDLHLTGVPPEQVPSRVYATRAAHDPIALVYLDPPFGTDPIRPEFGGHTFASDPGSASKWYLDGFNGAAHSQYWDIGNGRPCKSLVNLGEIIAGGQPTTR